MTPRRSAVSAPRQRHSATAAQIRLVEPFRHGSPDSSPGGQADQQSSHKRITTANCIDRFDREGGYERHSPVRFLPNAKALPCGPPA